MPIKNIRPVDLDAGKMQMTTKLNRRERKAAQLLKHYETCEQLGKYLGMNKPDGKKISVALFKAERLGARRALALCNDSSYTANGYDRSQADKEKVTQMVVMAFAEGNGAFQGLPGFFVNGDPRGYALKIDNETPEGKALLEAVKLHTDWGGYGILSPEITGD